jgi:hypothetical protein
VPEAMRACKYTLDESSHPKLQMAIRRSYAKATGGKLKSPPEIIDKYSAATTIVSLMTNVNRDDNNNADTQRPTSKENQTNDKRMNNEQTMKNQTMNEQTTMNKRTDNKRSNER